MKKKGNTLCTYRYLYAPLYYTPIQNIFCVPGKHLSQNKHFEHYIQPIVSECKRKSISFTMRIQKAVRGVEYPGKYFFLVHRLYAARPLFIRKTYTLLDIIITIYRYLKLCTSAITKPCAYNIAFLEFDSHSIFKKRSVSEYLPRTKN